MTDRHHTARCGLYCPDCVRSNQGLFAAAAAFKRALDEVNFHQYAAYKAASDAAFADYAKFAAVFEAIRGLECPTPCGEGGLKPECRVQNCVIEKNFAGCWQCADFKDCELLAPLKARHEDLAHNLEMLKQHGLSGWADKRGRHYCWDVLPRPAK